MKKFALSQETADRLLNDDINVLDVLDDAAAVKEGEDVYLQELFDSIAADYGFRPDDDRENIAEIMLDEIAADFG